MRFGLPLRAAAAVEAVGSRAGLTYAAIGASDTVGVGADDPARDAWVTLVWRRLPSGSRFVRLGVSGALARHALVRQVPLLEAARPDIATVWLGVNDLNARIPLDRYGSQLARILARIRASGARAFVGNIPDLTCVPAYADIPAEALASEIVRRNEVIAQAAHRNGAVLVDVMRASRATDAVPLLVASDGFHPSTEGHRVLSEVFWAAITCDTVIGPAVAG
jgi:lysophospholipase L1-like esterase